MTSRLILVKDESRPNMTKIVDWDVKHKKVPPKQMMQLMDKKYTVVRSNICLFVLMLKWDGNIRNKCICIASSHKTMQYAANLIKIE